MAERVEAPPEGRDRCAPATPVASCSSTGGGQTSSWTCQSIARGALSYPTWTARWFPPRSRGPIPKWCSATGRHRAWEQTRAAASGRSAVQIVERRIEVPTAVPLTLRDWPRVLRDLTTQLDDGRVYDRDLPALAAELRLLLAAYQRRQHVKNAPGLS
jgi:hypothetical protein